MTKAIKDLIASQGLIICPNCQGEGELLSFCGHETTTDCYHCGGNGIIRSLKLIEHHKKCIICNGRIGGCGGCNDPDGLIKWQSYELI